MQINKDFAENSAQKAEDIKIKKDHSPIRTQESPASASLTRGEPLNNPIRPPKTSTASPYSVAVPILSAVPERAADSEDAVARDPPPHRHKTARDNSGDNRVRRGQSFIPPGIITIRKRARLPRPLRTVVVLPTRARSLQGKSCRNNLDLRTNACPQREGNANPGREIPADQSGRLLPTKQRKAILRPVPRSEKKLACVTTSQRIPFDMMVHHSWTPDCEPTRLP